MKKKLALTLAACLVLGCTAQSQAWHVPFFHKKAKVETTAPAAVEAPKAVETAAPVKKEVPVSNVAPVKKAVPANAVTKPCPAKPCPAKPCHPPVKK